MSDKVIMQSFFNERSGRVNIRFSSRPSDEVRSELKAFGWRYSVRSGAWYPLSSEGAMEFSDMLRKKYFDGLTESPDTSYNAMEGKSQNQGKEENDGQVKDNFREGERLGQRGSADGERVGRERGDGGDSAVDVQEVSEERGARGDNAGDGSAVDVQGTDGGMEHTADGGPVDRQGGAVGASANAGQLHSGNQQFSGGLDVRRLDVSGDVVSFETYIITDRLVETPHEFSLVSESDNFLIVRDDKEGHLGLIDRDSMVYHSSDTWTDVGDVKQFIGGLIDWQHETVLAIFSGGTLSPEQREAAVRFCNGVSYNLRVNTDSQASFGRFFFNHDSIGDFSLISAQLPVFDVVPYHKKDAAVLPADLKFAAPRSSMWGGIQHRRGIARGVWSVSTSSHGGIMVSPYIAEKIFSAEARSAGVYEKGFYQYEEDSDASVAVLEIWRKGLAVVYDGETANMNNFITSQNSVYKYNKKYWEFFSREEGGRFSVSSDRAVNPDFIQELMRYSEPYTQFDYGGRKSSQDIVDDYRGRWKIDAVGHEAVVKEKDSSFDFVSDVNGEQIKITKGTAKEIRERCREILQKPDSEITDADKKILALYEGAGGLHEDGQTDSAVLSEFYTPPNVIDAIWSIVDAYAPSAKTVLEPSAGTGRFASGVEGKEFTMYEIDETSARIARLLYPDASVIQGAYQKQFFDVNGRAVNRGYVQPKFDVVVGNPPFVEYKDMYRGLGEGKEFDRYEEYFLFKGLDALKDANSFLVMVMPSGFLNSAEDRQKRLVSENGFLVGAYRLPEGAFPSTRVGTDIVIFRKWDSVVETVMSDDREIARMKEIHSGLELSNGFYFEKHPERILGEVRTRTNRFGKEEQYVALPEGKTLDDMLSIIHADSKKLMEQRSQDGKAVVNAVNMDGLDAGGVHGIRDNRGADKSVKDEPIGVTVKTSDGVSVDSGRQYADGQGLFNEHKVLSRDEFSRFYNGGEMSHEDFEIWAKTAWDGTVSSENLSDSARDRLSRSEMYIQVRDGVFMNREIFTSGDIYGKMDELDAEKENISAAVYDGARDALLSALPPKRGLVDIHIPALSNIAEDFTVEREVVHFDRRTGERLNVSVEEFSIREDFLNWATSCLMENSINRKNFIGDWSIAGISREDIPDNISWYDVCEYIYGRSVIAEIGYTEDEKAANALAAQEKRETRREVAERLFDRYIHTALSSDEAESLENMWNRRFNAVREADYSKLPVAIDGMSTHLDGKKFILSRQQVKGVSYLLQNGNGILAYDVGVGKTATGIAANAGQLQTGRAKRPLIIVPKAVYTKWVHDIRELFPNIQVNELGNLSAMTIDKFSNGNFGLVIPEGSVSICTEQALQHISFEDASIDGPLFDNFAYLLGKTDAIVSKNPKVRASARKAIMNVIGAAAQTKDDYVFFERCGFDNVTVDEAHRFKNLFRTPRSSRPDKGGKANEFQGLGGGDPSKRALKMFAITQMVQHDNNDRNVFMLTATPFTNSPLEIYSMLAYVGSEALRSRHIYDIRDFCTEFADCSPEWSVMPSGEIKSKGVMKQFKSLKSLQGLLVQFIDKVDGEEAGVIRPKKETHKRYLELSDVQKQIMAHEVERMTDPEEAKKGGVLKAMGFMRMACVSPALLDAGMYPEIPDFPGFDSLVESSPKLKFVCDTVESVWREKKSCGQIIYMPYGVNETAAVKDYLVGLGIPKSAIGVISGGERLSQEKVDEICESFNDRNSELKILIGSKKIAEGMDLNGNSIALYNLMLDWNPTESLQVEGRIWRQGNKQKNVHIVYPLMEDSIESLIMQKHDEKSSRINNVFEYKGSDSLDVSSINPEEVKFDLIKDPVKRADFLISQQKVQLEKDISVLGSRRVTCEELLSSYRNLSSDISHNSSVISMFEKNLADPHYDGFPKKNMLPYRIKDIKDENRKLTARLTTCVKNIRRLGIDVTEGTDTDTVTKLITDRISAIDGETREVNRELTAVNDGRDAVVERERERLAEKRATDVPTDEQSAALSRYIIEHTSGRDDDGAVIVEKSSSVSVMPSKASVDVGHSGTTVLFDEKGNGMLFGELDGPLGTEHKDGPSVADSEPDKQPSVTSPKESPQNKDIVGRFIRDIRSRISIETGGRKPELIPSAAAVLSGYSKKDKELIDSYLMERGGVSHERLEKVLKRMVSPQAEIKRTRGRDERGYGRS